MHYLDCREERLQKTGDFPLAYYAVDEDFSRYRMPMHWHREAELIRVNRGSITMYLDDRELCLTAGDLLLIGGGVIHGGEPENCDYECIVFDFQALVPGIESVKYALRDLARNSIYLKSGLIESDSQFARAVADLYARAADFSGRETDMLSALFNFFSGELRALHRAERITVSDRSWQKAEQLKPALEYIEHNFGQRISLDTLASLSGFSPKYFCRYFRAIVRRSPIDYLNFYRIECAANFLTEEDLNVAEVAARCGYADSSAFIKQFRRYKGATPKQYKRLHLSSAAQ